MSAIVGEIAEPYASAIMSLAKTHNLTDKFGEDFRSLLSLLKDSPELRAFLGNPIIKPSDKKSVLERILGDQADPLMRNFLMLLVDRGRILFVGDIAQEYLVMLRKLQNVVLAEVTSAVALNEGQLNTVREKVQVMTGANGVEVITSIDPDLLGGVVIKVGSRFIDASVRGQLRRIGMQLKA